MLGSNSGRWEWRLSAWAARPSQVTGASLDSTAPGRGEVARRLSASRRSAMRSIFIALAWLLVAPLASEATILGDQVYLNVTTIDPPDLPVFGGSSILADGPVDFTFADLALDANDVPKYVFDVDFTGPDGLTVVITATRNTALDDINGQFRSFEFSGIHSVGDSMVVTNATLTGVSGTAAVKWQAGATITEVGPDYFTFETGSWNSSGVVQGDTIIATIQLDLQPVVSTGNTYEYDALDRLTRVNYPDGRFVTYSYDRAGNIVARAVPEPGLGSMVMAGILGLASLAGRRRWQGQGNAHVGRSVAVHGAMVAVFAMLVLAIPSPVSAQAGGRPVSGGDWHEAVREQIAEAEYEVSVSRGRLRGASEALQAPNRAHGFRTHFLDEGVLVTPREQMDESWELGLSFLSYGRGDDARRPGWAAPRADRKRVRYERGDVLEWFVNDRKGLEQGFTLRSAPRWRAGRGLGGDALLGERRVRGAGIAGPAFVALRVDGDAQPMLASDRQSVSFLRPGVPLAIAHYDHLVVADANGRVLDSWMEVFRDGAGHGIRLVFDDTDAEYPVEIDPLLTTPGWSAEGNQADDGFGFSVSGAGDVNADGYDDVLVGVPWYDGGEQDTGRAYLFFGSPAGLSTVPAWFASGDTPAVGEAGSRLGYSVAAAGDVDNDGFDDILVASVPPFAIVLPGTVYLYRGSPTGPSSVADWSLVGRGQHGLGSSIAGAADFNGDGFDDVVLGEAGALAGFVNRGRAYVFYGNATATLGGGASCVATSLATFGAACDGVPMALSAGVVWGEGGSDEQYGARVASAGNLNCDAYDDLILGQPAFDGRDGGRIQIYLGSAAGIDGGLANADYDLAGSAVNGNFVFEFGAALVSAAPLDGNPSSCGALLIGAPGKDRDNVIPQTGGVYVLEGSDPFPTGSTAPQLLAEGTIAWENFGTSLANVGDVNGDGAEDFLVGAPGEFTQQETPGRAYLLLGSAGIGGLNPESCLARRRRRGKKLSRLGGCWGGRRQQRPARRSDHRQRLRADRPECQHRSPPRPAPDRRAGCGLRLLRGRAGPLRRAARRRRIRSDPRFLRLEWRLRNRFRARREHVQPGHRRRIEPRERDPLDRSRAGRGDGRVRSQW